MLTCVLILNMAFLTDGSKYIRVDHIEVFRAGGPDTTLWMASGEFTILYNQTPDAVVAAINECAPR